MTRFDLFWFGYVTASLALGGLVLVINGHTRAGFCSLMAGAFVGISAEILLHRFKSERLNNKAGEHDDEKGERRLLSASLGQF